MDTRRRLHIHQYLAQYTACNPESGLVLNHKYVDSTIISHAQAVLTQNMNLDIVEADLAKRFPNKRKEHRSKDCLSLLLELKANLPEFTFHQLNHKHINMWTRSIVPFRLLYDSGILFKGKSIFHKDCKRFVKCIFTFLNYTRTRGLMEPLTKVFARLPGQGNKLLEQWLCVMFEIHDINLPGSYTDAHVRWPNPSLTANCPGLLLKRKSSSSMMKTQVGTIVSVINDYLMHINEFEGCAVGTISKKELVGALNHKPGRTPTMCFLALRKTHLSIIASWRI
ncbi:hypothetical protein BX661DRAFT_55814 [Kickxella alabastrina]|uniref:uncharacterized protein n=1 Tax=Kickxella alabastrina TaxID=61397 RepID=UPI00221F7589|nr:uncharacterized protein BX661DRAFT_55814 [Kickxella alabastrina]KAI7823432.1 hypothetical protein BX661DRAFT_55814 [Kickxella alabastrina]